MSIDIVSINVGQPKTVSYQKKELLTGIYKSPAASPIFLSRLNFEGDGQADLIHHGGADKAVCVYPHEHYSYWESVIGTSLPLAAFGENLTISGLTEEQVCIGDTFRLGQAVVQVSQPRQPCFKLSVKLGRTDLPLLVQNTGYTGYYFRVLEEGLVNKEDGLVPLDRLPKLFTLAYANRIMHQEKTNRTAMEELLQVEELSSSWKATFHKRLDEKDDDTRE
ncbi:MULTISPECIES: MOSC domain-containing protein [unclassified Paenibacillus]|uniref:MOSC domain-containing protein n=1 Tax=unclassified Paenibacillus TaxID=185978 RepID=UPI001AE976CD|nr:MULTISPECIES: MOSC domain-containing protein [unclassified Paenibacillus]MBP1156705.1 MOSC domain-containing protein YiiM [Paenibacillus sp. PvP091]MBP1172557.1 MOSC domain-containing protein YiiM [Paenibacillus sp. PvR098]MBP2438937.1 MOSC domain-containing protein YiiM [Paenibacillus sp. PvP052]